MSPLETKITVLVLIGAISIVLGLVPWKLARVLPDGSRRTSVLSVLLCFGGGVLLATSLTHILPEIHEGFEHSGIDYEGKPIAEIVFCAGFFLIYLIEEMVHLMCDPKVHDIQQQRVHRAFSVHSVTCEVDHAQLREVIKKASMDSPARNELHPDLAGGNGYQTFSGGDQATFEDGCAKPATMSDSETEHEKTSMVRNFLTILALSFHAVLEGLAVGLEEHSDGVWKLFGAVATHKFVISFSLGLELKSSKTPLPLFILYVVTWSLMSCVGIGVGIIISEGETETQGYILTISTLQGLAGGTILYVVVFEVLQRERSKEVSGIVQLIFVLLGFTAMLMVDIFAGHEHGHES